MRKTLRQKSGITLIALVVTIIVLLILAGIAISMISGNNGVLTKAVVAKKENEKGIKEETKRLLIQEATINEYTGSTLSRDEIKSKTNNEITGATEGVISEIKDFTEGNETKYLPIPKGMAYLEGTIDTGAVVVDTKGNEFVWVPIVEGAETTVTSVWEEPGVEPNSNNITDNINTEYNAMKTSVATYGGFYVGRYETSWTGTQVASVGNVDPMGGFTQVNNDNSTWYTFYTESKKLHNDSVVSGMIYNSQWNAMMIWMDDVINTNISSTTKFIDDSTGMGHYNFDSDGNPITEVGPIKTGSNDNYKVKNIYDLAGNMFELNQRGGLGSPDYRHIRGGSWSFNGTYFSASSHYGDEAIHVCSDYGSRLTLYIK